MTRTIDRDELVALLGSGRPVTVVETLRTMHFDAGHIPGAVHTPYHDLHEMPGELDPSRPIAVICASGQRAAVAASVLKALGARDVIHVVEGGVPLWRRQGWPID